MPRYSARALEARGVRTAISTSLSRSRPDFPMDVFQYIDVVHTIEDMFVERVDVSNRVAMRSHVRPDAERDAVYAF